MKKKVTYIEYTVDCHTAIHDLMGMIRDIRSGMDVRIAGAGSALDWFKDHDVDVFDDKQWGAMLMLGHLCESHGHPGVTGVDPDVDSGEAEAIYHLFQQNLKYDDFTAGLEGMGFRKARDGVWQRRKVEVSPSGPESDGTFGYISIGTAES